MKFSMRRDRGQEAQEAQERGRPAREFEDQRREDDMSAQRKSSTCGQAARAPFVSA